MGHKIVAYQQSENRYSTTVTKENDYRPVSSLHYWIGVSNKDFDWAGISNGDRLGFTYLNDLLIYRWAKDSQFGVASVAQDGTVNELFSENKDEYYNHLNFAFDIVDNDIYFTFVFGAVGKSTLTIKKLSGGVVTTVFTRTITFDKLNDLDNNGNTWLGVHELLVDGEDFYLLVPIGRNGRDISTSAGIILYKYSAVTQQLTPIVKRDFVQHGPCLLTKFQNDIYFVESPDVTNEYAAKNRNIDYNSSEAKGLLYRIKTSLDGSVEAIGNLYFDNGQAYNGQLPIKALEFDNDLNFIVGYGDIKKINQLDSDASNPNNWQWLSFGKKHRYKLPILKTTGDILSALTQISATIGSTLSIEQNIISVLNRIVRGALTTYNIELTDTIIYYRNSNIPFPEKGYLLIGTELIRYTDKTATYFTGITRGVLNTEIQAHAKNDLITFVKRIIEDRSKIDSTEPYLQVTVSLDSQHLYNIVSEGSPAQIVLNDEESKTKFGDLPLKTKSWDNRA